MKLRSVESRFHGRWLGAAGLLLAAGIGLRSALYFPLAMFPIDSDSVLAGLCGFRVLDGQHPAFFPGGVRLSAASCYVSAGFFHLVGPGRIGLALTGLTWGILYLVFSLLFLRVALGPKNACLAFVFAVVSPAAFVTVTYIPWAYGEIMASCAATLWLAALWRSQGGLWQRLAFGFSVGFGMWISLQTLMIATPAILWIILWRRTKTLRESAVAFAGAIAGATPLLAANLLHGFPSLFNNWATQPAPTFQQAAANLLWLLTSPLPQLLFYGYSGLWSPSTLIILGYLLAGAGFVIALRRHYRDLDASIDTAEAGKLVVLVACTAVLLYVASRAGSNRGWTVRYIAPLWVALPLLLGIGTAALWRFNRWLAAAAVTLLVIPNLALYSLPGSAAREVLTTQLKTDAAVREQLARSNVRMIYGDYFVVYHINFDSHEAIRAIPTHPYFDYMDYGRALPRTGVRWAVLGYYPDQVRRWADAAGARGSVMHIGDLYLIIVERPADYTFKLLAKLRRTPN